MQEQTATGPNGEKVVLRGGQWVPMDAQPQGQQFPGVIQGNPRSLTPDQEQQMRLRENEEARKQATFEGTGGKPAEGDKKAASFLIRALGANSGFEDTGLGGRSIFTQAFDDVAPDLSNTLVNSSDRQVADAAQREFIAAVLRLDSGAAIPPAEEDSYKRLYFPEPGDSEDVVKFKKQARQRAIEGLRLGAGPLADDAMARFESLQEQYKTDGLQEGASLEEDNTQPPPVTLGNSQGADGYGDDGNGNPLVLKDGQALLGYLDSGAPQYGPPDQNENIDPRAAKLLGIVEKRNRLLGEGGTTDVLKSGNTLGLTDEASGVGEAIGAALKGDFDVVNNYQLGRDAEQMRIDVGRAHLGPGLSLATEALGGGASLLNKPGQVIRAGRAAAQAGNLTKQGVRQQLTRQTARDGAIVGGVGGFGYGEGFEGSTSNALVGATGGAALGYLGQKAGNALAARSEASGFNPARARQVAQAGEAEGVTVNRAMIDPRQENTFSGVQATRSGGPRVNRQMDEIEGQIEGRISQIGGGTAPKQEALGARAQEAVTRRQGDVGGRAGRLYERADQAAGGVTVTPTKAVAEIDRHIAELEAAGANANRGQIQYLRDIREDIANGISIRGLRDQRTNMRGQINERNLGQTDAERRIGDVLDAAADDIGVALSNNPAAKKLYGEADKIWRERAEFRRQIERDIIGPRDNPKSGTQAAKKLESWLRDDAPRFKRLWDSMDDAERAEVQGYVANALGRNAKGEFSPAIFLNNLWDGKTRLLSERTARIVFGDDGVRSIKNLKVLSEEVNRLNALRNSSNTGRVNNYRGWLFEALGFVGGGGAGLISGGGGTAVATAAAGGAAAFGVKTGRDIINARMLMNPKISKWLTTAPKTANPKAIDAHFNRLGDIAKAEPAIAAEIETLRRSIMGAANDNVGVAAAAEEPSQ